MQHTHCLLAPLGSMLGLINSYETTESRQLSYKSIWQWLSQSVSAVFYKITEWDVCLRDPILLRVKVLSAALCSWLLKGLSELQLQANLLWQINVEWRRHTPMCALVNIANGNITAGLLTLSNQRVNGRTRNSVQQLRDLDMKECCWKFNQSPSWPCYLHSLAEGAVCSHDRKHTDSGFILEEVTQQLYWDVLSGWQCYIFPSGIYPYK